MKLTGFLVLRLPELNFDKEGRGAYSKAPPRLGQIYYGGVVRMPWFDLDESCFKGSLPQSLIEVRKKIKSSNADSLGIELCYELSAAEAILNFSNANGVRNEIIAVKSDELSELKGRAVEGDSPEVDWLGYDFVSVGGFSLLEEGLFAAPSYFTRWSRYVTAKGVFSDPSTLPQFVADYQTAALKRGIEESFVNLDDTLVLELGRIAGK